ncbi:root hair defective 3 GTP-binding protein [Epithele typhae]|uniref:root hair defective 3 GTP-binding protein n=1 Tax=Epithele typhae TaxID=378194 RepID=UPI002008448B|nr:root hair defective 3 GTP-binding protein [Epithele typhae]KAH9942378.1 root hair defective 3 GTP-binding protein [Epithele typhae]
MSSAAPNGHYVNGSASGTDASTERTQIINDDKEFNQDLDKQIEQWGLQSAGFDYNLVAVFGSQSTGKVRTLLNRLFGTNFDVMDETRRQQTTKGIWMCKGKGMNVLVMDVEGTDGRERGEDQDFERKSALFSLASSEVLIVNIWEHQVGLYQGANMGLLKTVFEVNLGLFGKKTPDSRNQRTLLLFVIRDFIGATPLENLRATLTADMQKIWETLSKPAELKDKQLSDYFDLSFAALPHKILAADKFETEIGELRKRFLDKSRNDFLFSPSYHKRIPADGVAFYMEGIWEQVQTNKDLDLPTQRELLAQFRCDEISSAALTEFNEQVKPQRRPVESGKVVNELGKMMRAWRTQALDRYDRDASRYHQGVYKRKRADLVGVLDSTLSPLFLGQLKNLHKACLAQYKKEMLDGMRGEGYNFADVVSAARDRLEVRFLEGAKEAIVEGTDWSYEEELSLLREEARVVADQCRKDETKKMVNLIERNFKKQISDPVELYLNKPTADMWDKVLKVFQNTTALASLRKRAWLALRSKIDEQTADAVFLGHLRTYFEERFRYDEAGTPRVWKPDDDIDGAFKKARNRLTLELITVYWKIKPLDASLEFSLPSEAPDPLTNSEDFDFPVTLTIFSETKALDLTNRFRKDADAYYRGPIPYWMYGVLVVLGWNEAMVVLFNPIYFAMLLLLLASAYLIVQLGMVGPVFQIFRSLGGEVHRQVEGRLREHFSEPVRAQPIRSSTMNRTRTYSSEDGHGGGTSRPSPSKRFSFVPPSGLGEIPSVVTMQLR